MSEKDLSMAEHVAEQTKKMTTVEFERRIKELKKQVATFREENEILRTEKEELRRQLRQKEITLVAVAEKRSPLPPRL